jgi:hypothetical protein
MDPVFLQGSRPRGAAASDPGAALRQGRVVAGEVISVGTGGSLVVGVGRERVHATSAAGLEPGRRYLFELHGQGAGTELRALAGQSADESALLSTLRAALGAEAPLGLVLDALERELRKPTHGMQRDAHERLRRGIARATFSPTDSGAALAAALRASGQCYEARWLAQGVRALGSRTEELAEELAAALVSDWVGGADAEPFADALRQALRAELAAGESRDRARPTSLGVLMERAFLRLPASLQREDLFRSLRAFELDTLPRPIREALARCLCEAAPSATTRTLETIGVLAGDLKCELLRARAELERGPTRKAVERALAAIEAEQWINVARQAAHLPSHWSLPVRSGDGWDTAHLFVHRAAFRALDAAAGSPISRRFALARELRGLGVVQVDTLLGPSQLALRVVAPSESALEILRCRLADLERLLERDGRSVRVSAALARGDAGSSVDPVRALAYLSDHNVLDIAV